ncbi:G2/M phase-specific E3 ubiquitin-protein ligase-like, partial [Clarias magur]
VSESKTLEELQHSTEPITDYLANAGCLRPLKSIEEKERLIEDVHVISRVRGPFESGQRVGATKGLMKTEQLLSGGTCKMLK